MPETSDQLQVGEHSYRIHRLDAVADADQIARLPYVLRILLENVLRHVDGENVTDDDVRALVDWNPAAEPSREVLFTPARVLLQDFTGVPVVVDIAAMRDAMEALGGDPSKIDPQLPADLVIDHSIIAEVAGVPDAFRRNAELEFQRNRERYEFLRWGQQAFERLRIVPPNTGIVHQVNLEYLGRVVFVDDDGDAYPDTLVGTDSHTPMINGLGVLGWGVGGIEAEAAMLGQPISLLVPRVVGFKLTGELPEGTTATDLVLTVTELLRAHGVVGKFVEFHGPGISRVPLPNRATIGNMSPEYGSTCAIFPIDDETLRYLEFTGRDPGQIALVEAYARAQGLFWDPDAPEPTYSETVELDLSTVQPSLAGPTRPQDRVSLIDVPAALRTSLQRFVPDARVATGDQLPADVAEASTDEAVAETFPASDPLAIDTNRAGPPLRRPQPSPGRLPSDAIEVTTADGAFTLDHGAVVIAAITSCTNTSNPEVMLAAGLLARNAVERGLQTQPWVKASLAPGSQVVMDYYERAGLRPYLEKLRFNLVGFGCTTCIGNSGPLAPEISAAIAEHDLAVCSVLSGNRNFEGRINPDCKLNWLASPPLVVAYALAGTLGVNLVTDPLGTGADGEPVHLRDIWPSTAEVTEVLRTSLQREMFTSRYADVFAGDEHWRSLPTAGGDRYDWSATSTYVRRPTFFDGMPAEPAPLTDIRGARVLALLGDSVTTDHISPAGSIAWDGPAGRWLRQQGVERGDFNSYGSRRGNHEVMVRGTFANIRLRNLLVPGTEGGYTRYLATGEGEGEGERQRAGGRGSPDVTDIHDAAQRYAADGTPLVVLAGSEYGSGSSRDWAAKGPSLLGVRAVIAASYERIHRSNLIGMGILPLQFPEGSSAEQLGLTGEETFDIVGLAGGDTIPEEVTVTADDVEFRATVRIDTPREADYYRHGGILQYVLRHLR
ncbi:MAG TPA: aconitate hydratase [Euzebyales bacterium]|nr:aconitate hydratase [Euzebyales bacterium]